MQGRHRYWCFGLSIASDLPLPELTPVLAPDPGSAEAQQAVVIRSGPLPRESEAMNVDAQGVDIGDGTVLIRRPGIADFLVSQGCEIVVQLAAGGSQAAMRFMLLGQVFGVLLLQRRHLLLHASAIEVEGRCIAFVGRSTAGKSTLAARLASRGYQLVSDDVCVLDFETDGEAITWPAMTQLKLGSDSLSALGQAGSPLQATGGQQPKFYLPMPPPPRREPLPLARLYFLQPAGDHFDIAALQGLTAFRAVLAALHGRRFHQRLGIRSHLAGQVVRLLAQVPAYVLPLRRGFEHLDQEVARIEHHWQQQQPALPLPGIAAS